MALLLARWPSEVPLFSRRFCGVCVSPAGCFEVVQPGG